MSKLATLAVEFTLAGGPMTYDLFSFLRRQQLKNLCPDAN